MALTVGLVWWIAAWALGIKAFDAFLLTLALVIGAATARMIAPFLQQLRGREAAPSEERGVERA